MSVAVSLKDIVEAMEMSTETMESFFDPESGEIVSVTEDDRFALQAPNFADMPEWERKHLERVRRIIDSEHVVQLPDAFDINEWSIMEKFCYTLTDERRREELADSIHGKGAFQRFREGLERFGIRDEWFAFRQATLEQIARDWLGFNNIPFNDVTDQSTEGVGGLTSGSS
jgi:hypothetical protein